MKKQMLRGALMMGCMLLSAGLVIAQGPPLAAVVVQARP
jgi:hypothetical protein